MVRFLLQPLRRVVKSYILDGGYRDGVVGFLYAMHVLTGTFNWYATAWDRANRISRAQLEGNLKTLWGEKGQKV